MSDWVSRDGKETKGAYDKEHLSIKWLGDIKVKRSGCCWFREAEEWEKGEGYRRGVTVQRGGMHAWHAGEGVPSLSQNHTTVQVFAVTVTTNSPKCLRRSTLAPDGKYLTFPLESVPRYPREPHIRTPSSNTRCGASLRTRILRTDNFSDTQAYCYTLPRSYRLGRAHHT